ncbi:MAG: hypothetical protein J0M12_16040 [Deltaproteobacteria bacterium]|nr:hypothetical protein [Deltaproteobacteria bacterium]
MSIYTLRSLRIFCVAYLAFFIGAILVWRWASRGIYVSGWGLLESAEGTRFLFENGLLKSLSHFFLKSRAFQYWNGDNSVIYPVITGFLNNYVAAGLLWEHGLNLTLTAAATFACATALRVDRVAFYAALATSSAVFSSSIFGFPHVSAFFPWSAALILIHIFPRATNWPKLNFVYEVLGWYLVGELALHGYDLGKTVPIVPLVAAFTIASYSARRRAGLLSVSIALYYLCFVYVPSSASPRTTLFFEHLDVLPTVLYRFVASLFQQQYADLPFLFALGLLALFLPQRNRFFWTSLWLAQFCFILFVSTADGDVTGDLKSRRLLLLNYVSALAIANAWVSQLNSKVRAIIVLLIAAGQVGVVTTTWNFLADPERYKTRELPHVNSQGDNFINRSLISDAEKIAQHISSLPGKHVLTIGYSNSVENTTDPAAVPERIYLSNGPEISEQRTFFIGDHTCRYSCLRMLSFQTFMEQFLKQKGAFYLYIYSDKWEWDEKGFRQADYYRALDSFGGKLQRQRCDLALENFDCWKIEVSESDLLPQSPVQVPTESPTQSLNTWTLVSFDKVEVSELRHKEVPPPESLPPLAAFSWDEAFSKEFAKETSSIATVTFLNPSDRPLPVELKLRANDEVIVEVNGLIVFARANNHPATSTSVRFLSSPGANRVQVFYSNHSNEGGLSIALSKIGWPRS